MMKQRQSFVHLVTVDGLAYDLKDDASLAQLEQRFTGYFGPYASIWDLIEAFATVSQQLSLDSLEIGGLEPDLVETCASFRHGRGRKRGSCKYYWRRLPNGTMERTRDAVLELEGSGSKLSLQIHANMVTFARKLGVVRNFEVEARLAGRYAYRSLNGVTIDAATRESVGAGLERHSALIGVPHDADAFVTLRSPWDLANFVLLEKIPAPWMELVSEIIERQGFDFTFDQVVDVVRRPGLALLLDHPSYTMMLDVTDERAYEQFLISVHRARQHEPLGRLRGLFGSPFQHLPKEVRNALITYRPYVFPRPRATPAVPDLDDVSIRPCPWRVSGYRTEDDVVLEPDAPDPEGVRVRKYRAREVQQVVSAIDDGVELITVTGLSGSGKTELVSWRLETLLTEMGHRVVSLDALKLLQAERLGELLQQIDDVVRPTITIFDESLYIRGKHRASFIDYCRRFLKWPGQHLVLVGGGRTSPGHQRRAIETELPELFEQHRNVHVELMPKPVNRYQAYRFLGLGRLYWLSEAQRIELLTYVLERYPPYFIPLMPIRFHEHPQLNTLEQAKQLVDRNVLPNEWRSMTGMLLERLDGAGE